MFTKLRVVLNEIKLIKHLAIRPTWVTDWCCLGSAVATPPVFAAVIVEDALTWLDATGRAMLFAADVDTFRFDPLFGKFLPPQLGCFGVFGNIVLGCTNETRYIQAIWVEPYFLGEECPHPSNLLFLKVVAQAPVTEHLEEGGMAIIANIVNVLSTQAGLRVGDALALWVCLTQQIWDHRLHARTSKECRRVVG